MRILVTAGPTQEAIDPVRFISNRSTGKMGYAVARAAARHGHTVILVSGPVCLTAPEDIEVVRVTSADEMYRAVRKQIEQVDVLVMTAAVADWRPVQALGEKLKKGATSLSLELEPTPDILRAIASVKGNRIYVGFAAETEDLLARAEGKLKAKGLDLIVANDVSRSDSGFASDTNQVTFLTRDAAAKAFPLMSKDRVAEAIIGWVEARAAGGGDSANQPPDAI